VLTATRRITDISANTTISAIPITNVSHISVMNIADIRTNARLDKLLKCKKLWLQ